jgi:glycosyltransferase involved in cell wall biosynthesis
MKIVSTGYVTTAGFSNPEQWLNRISFYTGILEELAKTHEVHSIEQISYKGELKQRGVQYHFLNFTIPVPYFPFSLHSYIKKLKPDIVFVNGFIFPLQIIPLRQALGNQAKIIIINHAERPSAGTKGFIQRQADRAVHKYFFTSKEQGMDWVKKRIIADENKIAEVMEASSTFTVMDKEQVRAKTKANGHPVFLWVGRLDSNKDPMTVIKAFAKFIVQQPSAKLYMAYHTEALKNEILNYCEKNTSLHQAVTLVGNIPHQELQYWYSSADFIISASHYEGSGVAVCEAMSCGCIPLLTNIQSFRKMTGPGKCGFLYEPGDDAGLLKLLLQTRVMNMEEETNKVLKQFKEELSFEAIGKKINSIISSL